MLLKKIENGRDLLIQVVYEVSIFISLCLALSEHLVNWRERGEGGGAEGLESCRSTVGKFLGLLQLSSMCLTFKSVKSVRVYVCVAKLLFA